MINQNLLSNLENIIETKKGEINSIEEKEGKGETGWREEILDAFPDLDSPLAAGVGMFSASIGVVRADGHLSACLRARYQYFVLAGIDPGFSSVKSGMFIENNEK